MKPRTQSLIVAALLGVAFLNHSHAQVPGLLSYQGRIQVDGTPFTGTGQFKFSLVSPNETVARQATATANVINGFVISYVITDGGAGYDTPPVVTLSDPTGTGAVATAIIDNGVVIAILADEAGSGYSANPTVTIAPPPLAFDTLWSNDDTGVAGSEPTASIDVEVEAGLFKVLLGDPGIPGMASLPASVFAPSDVRIRVWFDDGVSGFSQLAPDQRIAAVGYALQADHAAVAGSVPWSGITDIPAGLADGTDDDTTYDAGVGLNLAGSTFSIANLGVNNAQLGNNSVNSEKLASDTGSLGKITANVVSQVGANIGIGVGNPTSKLHVNGDVVADSYAGNGGALTALDASAVSAGTLADAHIPDTIARDDEVIDIVKAGDGPGSGINADTLDGFQATSFWRGARTVQATQNTPLAAGAVQSAFSFGFPSDRLYIWRAVPTADGAKLKLEVEEELDGSNITYRFRVTNTGTVPTGYQLTYFQIRQ